MPTMTAEVKVEASIDFEVFCDTCGKGLCNATTVEDGRKGPRINIEPCETCLAQAKNAGIDEGYDRGFEAGKEAS